MDRNDKNALVAALVGQHDGKLRAFPEARLRHARADVPDLMQEIFLRIARIDRPDAIRFPEAYLFTVARRVLHEHRERHAPRGEVTELSDVLADETASSEPTAEEGVYASQRLAEINQALSELPRKAYVTLILNRVAGMPLEQSSARVRAADFSAHTLFSEW